MSSTEPPSASPANVLPKVAAVKVADGERLRSVHLPGVTLTVRSRPPAREGLPPALYVHGLGGSSQNWSALMPLLDGVVDNEALDLPGFGDSPPPDDGDYSITGHARAVIRYLDASGRGPVHLFGNSLGGAVTTRVAAARPDLVRTLTLVSPALPEIRVQRSAVPTGLLAVPGVAALFTRLTREWTAEQRVRGVTALCYGDPGRVSEEGFRNAVEEMERLSLIQMCIRDSLGRDGAFRARHRQRVHAGRPARAVATGRTGSRTHAPGLRWSGPTRRLPHGPAGRPRLP